MYFLYSALLAAALLLASPFWLFEMLRHGKYRHGLPERLGFVPSRIRAGQRCIWLHAVSVGEVLAVTELIRQLRNEFPGNRVVVSTTTDTGRKLAASRFGAENVFYFPFDFAFAIHPYLRALRPELVIVAETEFWPNFLRLAKRSGAKIAVVNARISDRSFPGYRRWRFLLTRILRNIDLFLAQTNDDARRLAIIGAPSNRILTSGNLKFDVPSPTPPAIVQQLRSQFQASATNPVLVFGSTVEGEEEPLLDAFKAVLATYPQAVLLLAVRHPERFEPVARIAMNLSFNLHRRSSWNGEPLSGSVFLIDTIGELASLYSLANIAFVGGSLVPRGGHSILEPAQHGIPILVGPHTENFRDIVDLFRTNDALRIVSREELIPTLLRLLANDSERQALGRRALHTLQSQRGATQFTLEKLRALLETHVHEAYLA